MENEQMNEDKYGLTIEEQIEAHDVILRQLGYVKTTTGRWIKEIQDDGQGFPRTIYTCPFCNQVTDYNTNYCPNCGSRLMGDE